MLNMHETEGLLGRELSTMYIAAARLANKRKQGSEAKMFARRGLELESRAVGTDSPLYTSSLRAVEALTLGPLGDVDAEPQLMAAAG
jgi:hypothetical protein